MAKLRTLKPQVQKLSASKGRSLDQVRSSLKRTLVGNRLQKTRFDMWKADPHCAMCGRLVAFPGGFELDHKTPNADGGDDAPSNLQILCVDEFERDKGCHAIKTKQDIENMKGIRRGY